MTYYLVHARPRTQALGDLRARLESGAVAALRPFGATLDESLRKARRAPDGAAVWEEEDYCRPPLAQERAAVLDEFFDDLSVEPVRAGEGWRRIADLPSLWTTLHHLPRATD